MICAMVSQMTDVSMICSAVCLGADQRKHRNSASLAFVRGILRWPVNSPHKGPVTRFHLMTSSFSVDWHGLMSLIAWRFTSITSFYLSLSATVIYRFYTALWTFSDYRQSLMQKRLHKISKSYFPRHPASESKSVQIGSCYLVGVELFY